jgi:hypothetical protein
LIEHAGGHHRHDGYERFHGHGAVADEARVVFVGEQLRRRTRRDQGVKSRDGAARNGDEHKRKHVAAEDRPGTVDELCERRHFDFRVQDHDRDRERDDRADLHERRQIVAWREQQPDRQHRCGEAVENHHQRERWGVIVEPGAQHLVLIDPAAAKDREQQQRHADGRAFEHPPGPQVSHE